MAKGRSATLNLR